MKTPAKHPFPDEFKTRIKQQFASQADEFISAMENQPSISIRINHEKFPISEITQKAVDWCNSGFFLSQRPVFTLDPLLHTGAYYVQESSSMFLEQAFRKIEGAGDKLILDLCAAPGGKSTHLLSLMGKNDLLVANEVIQSRCKILQENIRKWGSPNVVITNNDPKDFGTLNGLFDVIVIDAPCSGEGLFRRDTAARNEWSPANAHLCSVRQRRILADVWPALKNNGYLIYSTCTFNPEENEENLKWLKKQSNFSSIRIPLQPEWKVDELEEENIWAYRFLPHKVKGEGFFITIFQKKEETTAFRLSRNNKNKATKLPSHLSHIRNWIIPQDYNLLIERETVTALPQNWENEIHLLRNALKVITYGLPITNIKGKNTIPFHELALSPIFNHSSFATIGLDIDEALKYLHKEEIKTNSQAGWQLVQFKNIPLGFVKNLGNRSNNYYPKEWRIRMQNSPDSTLWYEF